MFRALIAAVLALIAIPTLIAAPPALAQSLWIPRDRERAVMLEVLKPMLDEVEEDFPTLGAFLGFRSTPKSKVSITGEASLARVGYDVIAAPGVPPSPVSSFSFGNAYLGIEYGNSAGPWFGELGARLPMASASEGEARVIGLLSDLARWEAFLDKAFAIQAAINLRKATPSGLHYRLRLSPAFIIPSERQFNTNDPELFAIYSGQIGMDTPSIRAGVGLIARTWISESDLDFSERTQTQLDAHVDFLSGSLRPGIEVKTPLDEELNDAVPVTVGVSLSYSK